MQSFARRVDSDVQALYNRTAAWWDRPPAVRLLGQTSTTARVFRSPFSAVHYNTDNMSDLAADSLRVNTTGWYYVVGNVRQNTGGESNIMCRVLVNNTGGIRAEGPGATINNVESSMSTEELFFLRAGDYCQLEIRRTTTTSNQFDTWLTAHMMLQVDD